MFKFRKLNNYQMAATLLAVIFVAYIFGLIYVPIDISDENKIKIKIEKGWGLNQVASELKKSGLIKSQWIFKFYVLANGHEDSLKAGTYSLSKSFNLSQMAEIIIGGFADINDIQILLAEGFNIWEIDERLAEFEIGIRTEFSKKYLEKEGYLFPDTYRISRPSREDFDLNILSDEVATKMSEAFNAKTAELFASLSEERKKEIIIIASMIEKEARIKSDMHLVSGIIKKRLERDMLLQIDATVAYGACLDKFKLDNSKNCDVTRIPIGTQIKIDGPYNSYMRKGLPPAPISNPGSQSIKAALEPKDSPYLYYLSTRDTGQIIYSKTGAEHEANRRKYLLGQ